MHRIAKLITKLSLKAQRLEKLVSGGSSLDAPQFETEPEDYLDKADGKFFYFVTRGGVLPSARLHARMLFYNGEDPATGSAAGCAAAWMTAHGVAQPDERVLIEQGVEMQRPSHIFVRAGKKDNRVINVRVGGNVVEIMRAEVFL